MTTSYIKYPGSVINSANFPLLAPAGSAAAPSYSFSGDSDTGMYSPGANQIALSTGGAQTFLDNNGLITIGVVSGTQQHVINGELAITKSSASDVAISLDNTNAVNAAAHADFVARTANGGGDPYMRFIATGADTWAHGLERLTTSYKISRSNTLGTNDHFVITSGGIMTLGLTNSAQSHIWNGKRWSFVLPSTGTDSGQWYMQGQAAGHGGLTSYLEIASGNTTADASYIASISGGQSWSWGLDNSNSDSFSISSGTTLGTNEYLNISSAGLITLGTGTSTTHRLNTNVTTGATGGADTLPANPVGFITININGTARKIPYYAT